jgi:hypothetical protein
VSRRAHVDLSISPTLERSSDADLRGGPFQDFKVSAAGQMSLPVAARRRWEMMTGGIVEIADLGFGLLVLPTAARAALLNKVLSREALQTHIESLIDDPDLGS